MAVSIDAVGRNCLAGMRCSGCGNKDNFRIVGLATFDVYQDGSEAVGDHEWDADSPCYCPECGRSGVVKDFCPELERCGKCEACEFVANNRYKRAPRKQRWTYVEGVDKDNPCETWKEVR